MRNRGLEDAFEKVGRVLSERYGIKVVFEGNRCCTNGRVIMLPALPPEVPPKVMGALRCYLDHEVGHILGSSNFELARKFREKHGEEAFGVLNALEDLRTDRVMRRAYAGCGVNLRTGFEEVARKLDGQQLEPLRQFTTGLYTRGSGYPDLPCVMTETYALCDQAAAEVTAAVRARSTAEVATLAEAIWRRLGGKFQQAPKPDPQPGQAGGPEPTAQPSGQGQDPAAHDATAQNQAQASGQPDPTQQAPGPAVPLPSGPMGRELAGLIEQGIASYTDTNGTYRPWTTAHDTVTVAPQKRNHDHAAMLSAVMPYVGGVRQKLLQSLLAQTRARWCGDQERGRLDPKTLNRLATGTGEKVFRQRIIAKAKSTAVALLIDLSGSMKGARLELAAQSALVFSEALDKLGIPSLIMGFSTAYEDMRGQISAQTGIPETELAAQFRTHPLRITVFKRPEEPWRKVSGRMAKIPCGNLTPLGEAILLAARAMASRPEERKVVLVLTDGKPVVGITHEDKAFKHAKDAISLCERSGIEIVLVGIMAEMVKDLTQKSVVVSNIRELPRVVIGQLHGILVKGGIDHGR